MYTHTYTHTLNISITSDGFMEKKKHLANQYAEEKTCILSFDLKDQVKRNA